MTSAPLGKLVPGVLSTGIKMPQAPYKASAPFTATYLYCFVHVPSLGADIRVRFRRNAIEVGTTYVTIAAGSKSGSLAYAGMISDSDNFDVDIKQVGTSPNEGSDLVWMVL